MISAALMLLACARAPAPPDLDAPFPARMEQLQRARDAAPDPAARIELMLIIAEQYRQEGMLEEAARAYQALLRDYPRSPRADEALAGLAQTLTALGRTDEAERLWQALLEQHPGSALAPAAEAALR